MSHEGREEEEEERANSERAMERVSARIHFFGVRSSMMPRSSSSRARSRFDAAAGAVADATSAVSGAAATGAVAGAAAAGAV